MVTNMIAGLTEQQRYVLDHRWGLAVAPPQTQPAIGAALGIRPTRVRDLEAGAIRELQRSQQPPASGRGGRPLGSACPPLSAAARADLDRYGRFVAPGALPARSADARAAAEWIAWLQRQLARPERSEEPALSA